jgi:hypothetical protein
MDQSSRIIPKAQTALLSTALLSKMGCQNFNSAFFFVYPVKNLAYTIWLFNIAMENGSFIDGLPIKNGDFPWLC